MAKAKKQLLAWNRGVISKIGLARIDLERMAMSAEQMTNWTPRVLGSMMLRAGLKFLSRMANDLVAGTWGRIIPFEFGADDTVLLQISPQFLQVRLVSDGDVILQSDEAVGTAIANDTFATSVPDANWIDNSDAGGQVTWVSTGGVAQVNGDGTDFGILYQAVNVPVQDQNKEHFLELIVPNGPIRFKVGTAIGDDSLFPESRLERGEHIIAFTPGVATFYVEFANEREFTAQVTACVVKQAAQEMFLNGSTIGGASQPHVWGTQTEMDALRWAQSGDVIYLSQGGPLPALKISRRNDGRSWSLEQYLPEDGPWRVQNVSGVTIAASALNGNITLTASEGIFRQEHADERSLFRIASQGQTVTKQISSANDFTNSIRVVGVGNARIFQIILEGTWAGTVTLQFSFDDATWNDTDQVFTANANTSYNDQQDDSIIYYRIGFKTGDYTSGTLTATLVYAGGSIEGVARVVAFTSSTVVSAHVLKAFGSTSASKDWWEGAWSDRRGWPSAAELYESRLFWAGQDKIWGSESDAYETFNDLTEGDAGAIDKQIGFGPIRVIHWLLGLGRLLIGTSDNAANVAPAKMDGNHPLSARSSNFDEPLTPFNFHIKRASSRGVFVDRTKQRLYELIYDIDQQDYRSMDLSVFAPDYNQAGIIRVAVQMKPDVRVHCVRADGGVGVLVYDRLENVVCWHEVTSPGAGGLVRDCAVLPGVVEDQVYYIVERTINGGLQRHVCKWALESEAQGGQLNKVADSFAEYSGAATVLPFTTELLHLRGETVEIWADGLHVGSDTVTAAGALTNPLATAASNVVAGLGYQARYKSAKLGEMSGIGLLERKKVNRLGFIAKWMHHQGLRYGPDFVNMSELPQVQDGKTVVAGTIFEEYHEDDFAFGGDWDTDSRICLEANAPKPVTLLAALAEMESVEKRKA
jgi:hypothetical protein